MSSVKPPPTYEPLSKEKSLIASNPWLLFFDQIFRGDAGTSWTPTFTSLTTVGSPTITGRYYQISKYLCYFTIKIVPSTSTTSVAGTTYANFPLTMKADGICFAVSGLLGSSSGMCDSATNRVYTPAWSAVTIPLTIIGVVEAT